MPTIKIDNIDYDTDKLSDEAKAQLVSIKFCDQELTRIQVQAAAYQTGGTGIQGQDNKAPQAALPTATVGDTIKFN